MERRFPDPDSLDLLEYLTEVFPVKTQVTFSYQYHSFYAFMLSLAAHGVTGQDFEGLGPLAVDSFLLQYRWVGLGGRRKASSSAKILFI